MEFSPSQIDDKAKLLHGSLGSMTTANGLCAFTEERCRTLAPMVLEIEALKRERNAIVLAHTYLSPEVQKTVADFAGDSYGLSLEAQRTDAELIVFAAVDFMAETAKLLNPQKTVLAPNPEGGCSLADSITGAEVRRLREQYPEHTFLCYINTTADVKAACDVTVTSSNVYGIVEVIENDKIFFLPDRLMAMNIKAHLAQRGISKQLEFTDGSCYVHEEYAGEGIPMVRQNFPGVQVLAHPECKPEVIQRADYVGSTGQMLNYVDASSERHFLVLTECGLVDKLRGAHPEKEFVGSCQLCKYMKANSLEQVLAALRDPTQRRVEIDPATADDARRCIEAMFSYTDKARAAGLID
jgi:quinolinate synthase